MSIQIISNITPFDYTPTGDRESADPTVFKLLPLNGMQYMEVMNELTRDANGTMKLSSRGLQQALKYGLIDWKNLCDENGKNVKFNAFNINKIPPFILTELAGEIIDRSEVGDAVRKNS